MRCVFIGSARAFVVQDMSPTVVEWYRRAPFHRDVDGVQTAFLLFAFESSGDAIFLPDGLTPAESTELLGQFRVAFPDVVRYDGVMVATAA